MRISDWSSDVCSSDLRFELAGDGVALDELGDFRADHVSAQQLAGGLVEHGLDEAFRLAERDRLAIADEGEFAGLHLAALFLRLGLGEADAGDLRSGIDRKSQRLNSSH